MTEHSHSVLVQKAYAAFTRGDMDALAGLLSGDAAHHSPGDHPLAGHYKGRDEIIGYYRRLTEETDGSMRVQLRQVLVDGRGHAMSLHHLTAERGGEYLDQPGGIVFRIAGDRITDVDECVADLDATNRFWS
ncbi:nuclear transport factor 2 family protein [Actinacidiphila glaucinigra]|uniref:nuclear transport factor 2 family protein n=1 Tax=Actinacidiphila glaucinigra TaxID=235986 RepID=UPI002E36B82F|nr:nuclear transport factor 2 family protein [Actinacidiphila glaucinigra]